MVPVEWRNMWTRNKVIWLMRPVLSTALANESHARHYKGIQTPHCLSQLTGKKNVKGKPSWPDFCLHHWGTPHTKHRNKHVECPNPCGKSVCLCYLVPSPSHTLMYCHALSLTPLLPSVRVNAASSSTTATRVRRDEAILILGVCVRCAGALCAGASQAVSLVLSASWPPVGAFNGCQAEPGKPVKADVARHEESLNWVMSSKFGRRNKDFSTFRLRRPLSPPLR